MSASSPPATRVDPHLARRLERWRAAGVVDEVTIERIRAWEARQGAAAGSRLGGLAFGFGGLLLGAGLLLFVASNWPWLSPAWRLGLLAATVAGLHFTAGAVATRLPALATALHAVGTCALGAGIFLAGQAFNLAEHWPDGFLVWAIGAAAALHLLRDRPHVLYVAVLVPAWLTSAWLAHAAFAHRAGFMPPSVGLFTLAVAYLAAPSQKRDADWRRTLAWLGAFGTLAAGTTLPFASGDPGFLAAGAAQLPVAMWVMAWSVAVGVPVAVGFALRGRATWPLLIALGFALVVARLDASTATERVTVHALYLAASVGLTAWGVHDAHRLRINVGVLAFAFVVLSFYFSSVFDKIDRSLGLVVLGVLFIGGGWLLERTRRRLLARLAAGAPP